MKTSLAAFVCLIVPMIVPMMFPGHSMAQEPKPETDELSQTIIFPTGTHDPREIASVTDRILGTRTTITPLMQHSALAIRFAERDREEIMSLLKALTPEVHLMRVRLTLLRMNEPLSAEETARLSGPIPQVMKALDNLKKSDRLELFNDAELTILQGEESLIQLGERIAQTSGSTRMAGGRSAQSYEWVEVGTIIRIIGKPDDQHVILDLNYEKSFKQSSEEDSESGDVPTGISTLSQQSTLRFPSGHAQLAGGVTDRQAGDRSVVHLLVVAAEVL